MEARPYQAEAVDAVYEALEHIEAPCISIPTGCGKSFIQSMIVERAISNWPSTRVVCAVDSQELVAQNVLDFNDLAPTIPAGVFSAGLNRREIGYPVTFCGIQSVWRRAIDFQWVDLLLVDEAHMISRKGSSMWQSFIRDLRAVNPRLRIIGLTATPFRMDSGSLTSGDGALFQRIVYEYTLTRAIAEGYLCDLVPRYMASHFDTAGVHTRGGEFIPGELERAVDVDSVTKAAVGELVELGRDRKRWLVYACGIKHAEHIAQAIQAHGISAEVVTGDTAKGDRSGAIEALRAGTLRALISVNALTKGLNIPAVDLIAAMRPTKSAGLFVQIAGRGMRKHPAKENCLFLDYGNLVETHGPLDMIKARDKDKGPAGVPPTKICPECQRIHYAGVRVCGCGYEWPVAGPDAKIERTASDAPLLSTQVQPAQWVRVDGWTFKEHVAAGKLTPTLRVDYQCGISRHSEWVTLEHAGFARERACAWWRDRGGSVVPRTVAEAAACAGVALQAPSEIALQKDGKWLRVVGHR